MRKAGLKKNLQLSIVVQFQSICVESSALSQALLSMLGGFRLTEILHPPPMSMPSIAEAEDDAADAVADAVAMVIDIDMDIAIGIYLC